MKLTFLGTGTSQGVPVIGCKCKTCLSTDPKDKRLRSSVLIEVDDLQFCIDAGPDFRQQMLMHQVDHLDAILLTHHHKDHMGGLDDVRAFNYLQRSPMKIYCQASVIEEIKREFIYAFGDNRYPGVPDFNLIPIENKAFNVNSVDVLPIESTHYGIPIFGYRIGKLAYLTDVKYITDLELEKLKDLDILIINALRIEPHKSHLNLEEALRIIEQVKPEKAYLTHVSHMMGTLLEVTKALPQNVAFAYDGLILNL